MSKVRSTNSNLVIESKLVKMSVTTSANLGGAWVTFAMCLIAVSASTLAETPNTQADLILYNAGIWTADEHNPSARAVAIKGSRILRVGTDEEVKKLGGARTTTINLGGKMVVPGFIDAHTHFENATDWFFEVRLIDVDQEELLIERLMESVERVPGEFWITGTDWGGFTARKKYSAGDMSYQAFQPTLERIDAVSGGHPVFLTRHDGAVFVNSQGLKRLRITRHKPDPNGGEIQHDPASGQLTGMLFGTAAARASRALPPKSRARTLVAARALVDQLNRFGITGIHDIARVDALSQSKLFYTFVERSYSDVGIFEDLRSAGDLSIRVYPLLPLRNSDALADYGIFPGSGDELIRYGALKAFIDGTLMFEPWSSNPSYAGDFSFRVIDEQTMLDDVITADKLGFDIAIHAIADKAHWLMLNWYERAIELNGERDRRFRLVHALYPAMPEIKRAGNIGAVADITPYWTVTDREVSERQLGTERVKTAYAWRTMIENGVRINIVSDWPGSFDKTEVYPLDPLQNIFYAVTRRPIGAGPDAAWHPEEAMTIEEALRAYTINPAWSSREEGIKGSISEGKLADLVVLSRNILQGSADELLTTFVEYTIFDGKVVYTVE